jgi:hypothetical protein
MPNPHLRLTTARIESDSTPTGLGIIQYTSANGIAMRISFTKCFFLVFSIASAALAPAAERPTLVHTNDPRPDILPRPFYENHTEYRARYNRPTFLGGWVAYNISRTSQEAMSWQENYCAGNYDQHHMPPMYKTYYYPKPWEVLQTGARPDFAAQVPQTGLIRDASSPSNSAAETEVATSSRKDSKAAFAPINR